MQRSARLLLLLALCGATYATAPGAVSAEPPGKVIALVVYGDDPCPQGTGDEIVVCARRPESERYRIPKPIRENPSPQGGPGWASQVAEMERAGRAVIPGSCSANGSYGFTGCTAAMLERWLAERRMEASRNEP